MRQFLWLFLVPSISMAFSVRETTLKSKAYMINSPGGVYEALDLRSKLYSFSPADASTCATNMRRIPNTFAFSCTLTLNSSSDQSKLRQMASQPIVQVTYGGVKKFVRVDVSADARTVTYSTRLDDIGIDHETAQFNEELYRLLAKVASDVIYGAMTIMPLDLRVLESPHTTPGAATVKLQSASR
jgi:hypothetical protein